LNAERAAREAHLVQREQQVIAMKRIAEAARREADGHRETAISVLAQMEATM